MVLIVGGLTYFPALALGPIVEHFANAAGTLFYEVDIMAKRDGGGGAALLDRRIVAAGDW